VTDPTAMPGVVARFGPYEVDVRSGEVRKFGARLRIGEQPLRILALLMERPGELVTREELRRRLWSEDTFVDFDHGLNSAVQRLRDGLSDTAEKARWIETVPRRGYRFVGSVEWTRSNGATRAGSLGASAPLVAPLVAPVSPPEIAQPMRGGVLRWRLAALTVACALAAIIAGRAVYSFRASKSPAPIRSLAVLPLENLSGDASQDYFADGMTDELITDLAKNSSLRVISRMSIMQYKGVHRSVRDLAHELGVDGILEGSVTRSANHVHMTVQLIHAASDTHVWAESYDRDLAGAATLPSELSQIVAREAKATRTPVPPQRYISPEAHDAYLHGEFLWYTENDTAQAQSYFEKAIDLQPDYAAAWSGLSASYGGRAVAGILRPDEAKARWEAAARKAVDLDDSLGEAHNSMAAWYFFSAWDWTHAESEAKRCVSLNPNFAEGHHLYSYVLTTLNRQPEALEEQKRGMEVDPFARPWALGLTYYHQHKFQAAINELQIRLAGQHSNAAIHVILADSYHFAGQEKQAAEQWEALYRVGGDQHAATQIQSAFRRGGFSAVAEWRFQLEKAQARKHYYSPLWLAMEAGRAQQREETLKLLEDAYRERSPRLVFLENEPVFDFLHAEPRYQAIVRKMNLPTNR
jgi:TolB-like protein/DNA-binding winged helix-turn-helix (wHTH) protein